MGIWETVELAQEDNEKEPWGDSCTADLENNWSKLAQERGGPNKGPFQYKRESHYIHYMIKYLQDFHVFC